MKTLLKKLRCIIFGHNYIIKEQSIKIKPHCRGQEKDEGTIITETIICPNCGNIEYF